METIAFLSSMMFLGVFGFLFWLDRTNRKTTEQARENQGNGPKDLTS
jgi:hypothetical protein